MLRRYREEDFVLLSSWVTDEDILFRFSGIDFQFPLSLQQFQAYQRRHPDRVFFIFESNDTAVGFAEIIPNEKAASVRLGRLLIGNPELRGMGLGKQLVRELIIEATTNFGAREIDLYVDNDNIAGITCYGSNGFHFSDIPPFTLDFAGRKYIIRHMRHSGY